MPAWPAGLPQIPLRRGNVEEFGDIIARTPMDVGPDKTRRRTTAGVGEYSISLLLTKSQVATFATFFKTTISGGALSFTWVVPRTQSAGTFRIFSSPEPTIIELSDDLFRVSFRMEKLP